MARRRRLTEEDRRLWEKVAGSVARQRAAPLARVAPAKHPALGLPKALAETPAPAPAPLAPFRIGEKTTGTAPAHRPAPSISEDLAAAPLAMDRRTWRSMRRGKMAPEGRIDLHGMTLADAEPALRGFVQRAHGTGKRLVLVITGKGSRGVEEWPIPTTLGALRRQVPVWLHRPPLAHLVQQVTPAHRRHGGEGALYVYLRRG